MDLIILVLYFVCVFVLAFFSRRKHTNKNVAEEHYLAGRTLGLFESTGSIIATEVSALTFLTFPASAYTGDLSLVYFHFGTLLSRPLISLIVIPRIYDKGLTLYGIMGKNNATPMGRKLTALIYSLTKLLGVGVRFYAGSILVAAYFSLSLPTTLFIIMAVTLCYMLFGGLRTVVRTDLLQIFLFVGCGVLAHIVISDISGQSWMNLMSQASDAGKTGLFSLSKINYFLIGATGGALFDLCTHGFDQDYSQRLLGAKDQKTAQKAMAFSCFASIAIGLLFLPIGTLLWAYGQSFPFPEHLKADKVFAYFITSHFPLPLQGLMLAGVLAGTMSTLDSTVNALSSVLWNDLLPKRDEKKIRLYFKIDTFVIALLLVGIAILASFYDQLFILGMVISSWSVAAVGVLFFSQLVFNSFTKSKLDGPTVLLTFLFNTIGVALNTFIIEGPWQWNVYYGAFFAAVFIVAKGRLLQGRPVKL